MRTRVGYAGGVVPHPTYRNIGDHTEAIEIDYDPSAISYGEILAIVWQSHDPLRNFGGRQYRHAIWYQNEEQKAAAEASRDLLAEKLEVPVGKIQTALEPVGKFTYAEDYHQKYLLRRQKRIVGDLETLFPNSLAFTDSTVISRLNGWFGHESSGRERIFREEILSFGLPDELEAKVLSEIS